VTGRALWVRFTAGLLAIFVLFHQLAVVLGSSRGEAGLLVAAVVVAATIAAQVVLFGQPPATAIRWLGLGRPALRGVIAALAIALLLALIIPAFAAVRGLSVESYPGWVWLLPGLFAQAGIAEETLFRGYLFHHVREGRTFWRAVLVSLVPFAAIHLLLFRTMPWPVAMAAVALAVAVTPPLAYLFELGGNTIWGPAILHFVIQGLVKIVQIAGEASIVFPIVWMAACGTVPFLLFLVGPAVTRAPIAPRAV
jgi:membrane protease YdiL (CAAX protease family)